MTAPEPADLARQHGAPWAAQLTQDEMDKAMRMTVVDYSWQHPPQKQKPERTSWLTILFCGLIAVLVSLAFGHVLVKAIANLAAFNGGSF